MGSGQRMNNAAKRQLLPDYEGIGAKIRRGADQASSLEADMGRFCTDIRQSIVHEVHEDTEEQAWVFRGETPNVPIDWSVRLGEILYNLRSALDHLVWQLVRANGQCPGRHNAFPIVKDDKVWGEQAKGQWALSGVSESAVDMIRRLQPYTGGPGLPFNVGAFWQLHSVCNIDKHRHLVFAIVSSDGLSHRHNRPPLDRPIPARPLRGRGDLGTIKKGHVMLSLNDAGVKFEPDFRITIRFEDVGEPEIAAGTVPNIVRECLEAVRGAVELLTLGGPWPSEPLKFRGGD